MEGHRLAEQTFADTDKQAAHVQACRVVGCRLARCGNGPDGRTARDRAGGEEVLCHQGSGDREHDVRDEEAREGDGVVAVLACEDIFEQAGRVVRGGELSVCQVSTVEIG